LPQEPEDNSQRSRVKAIDPDCVITISRKKPLSLAALQSLLEI
jgi:hypothetical protein